MKKAQLRRTLEKYRYNKRDLFVKASIALSFIMIPNLIAVDINSPWIKFAFAFAVSIPTSITFFLTMEIDKQSHRKYQPSFVARLMGSIGGTTAIFGLFGVFMYVSDAIAAIFGIFVVIGITNI